MNADSPEDVVADALAHLRSRQGRRRGGHAGHHGGGPALRRLVARLAADGVPLSVSDISIAVGVDQPRASRLVAQGVEMGLLRREIDPDDARRTRIALTGEGRRHAFHVRERRRREVASALEGFSDSERQQLACLLVRFANAWQDNQRS